MYHIPPYYLHTYYIHLNYYGVPGGQVCYSLVLTYVVRTSTIYYIISTLYVVLLHSNVERGWRRKSSGKKGARFVLAVCSLVDGVSIVTFSMGNILFSSKNLDVKMTPTMHSSGEKPPAFITNRAEHHIPR